MKGYIIENHKDDGVEWGVGIDSPNPCPQKYVACKTADDAKVVIASIDTMENEIEELQAIVEKVKAIIEDGCKRGLISGIIATQLQQAIAEYKREKD